MKNLRLVVNLGTATEEKVVDGLHLALKLLALAENVELLGTIAQGLLALRLAAGENDNVAAHGGSHLDGNVAETANAHNGNSVSGLDAILVENSPNSSTAAHQGSSISGVDFVGDLEDASGVNNSAVREAAGVGISVAISDGVGAVLVPALKTIVSIGLQIRIDLACTYQLGTPCSYRKPVGCIQIQRHRQP